MYLFFREDHAKGETGPIPTEYDIEEEKRIF